MITNFTKQHSLDRNKPTAAIRCLAIVILCLLSFCSSNDLIRIDLGRSDPDKILQYYFGIYQQSDPFDSGLLIKDGTKYFLSKSKASQISGLKVFERAFSDGVLNWTEMKEGLNDSYYQQTGAPSSVNELLYEGDSKLHEIELNGVMAEARRSIQVEEAQLQEALLSFESNGDQVIYPTNTTFIGQHQDESENVLETTVMRKLKSGHWAYWIYDAQGSLSKSTNSRPRKLKSPTQCIGCHMGQKSFEPEASFPRLLPEKKSRKRQIYVDTEFRNQSLVDFFDEHSKRSDSILGLYATTYMAQLQLKDPDQLTVDEKKLLDSFSF